MKSGIDRSKIDELLRLFSTAIATTKLYSLEHEQVQKQIYRIQQCLNTLFKQQGELTFMIVKKELLFEGTPLEQTLHCERIARSLHHRNIGYFSITKGVDNSEIELFIDVACGNQSADQLETSAPHIDYGEIDIKDDPDAILAIARFEDLSREELASIKTLYDKIADKENFDLHRISSIISGFVTAFQQECNPLLALVPLKIEDEYSFAHSINVAILNIAQATSLGFGTDLLHDVGLAGMLHDAGKIFVDKEIIRGTHQLSDAEWQEIKKHPTRGAQYLMGQDGVPQIAILTAFEHHMRYDMTGYPTPPSTWQLNLCSQMTMISDTFDALRTRRAYNEPWDLPRISGRMLEVAGSQLNPCLTMNFLKLLKGCGDKIMTDGLELSAEAPHLSEEELNKRCVCE
ncbi:MAG: HD domain-containing protein [Desulfuromonadales bacterium]|nr:HD domain-containing protein [Desulfuromonadales bacterium]